MSKRILNAEEINELLGRLKKGESNELIENQMNISLSTLSNFRSYFISQGHDLCASTIIKETASSASNTEEPVLRKPTSKRATTPKRKYTRSFQSFKGVQLKDDEVFIRINEVIHVLEKKPKVMTIGPTSLHLEF
jgi:hypothetical protein